MHKILMATAAALLLSAASAQAAVTPPDLCKDGQISRVRISKLKAPDSAAKFDKATRDQGAWYRSHGFAKNRLLVGTVMVQDDKTKDWSVSAGQMVTVHMDTPGPSATAKRDAGWDAFVAEFSAASEVTTDLLVCLREPVK